MPGSSHHTLRDKNMKKKPLMTAKEKKMAKQAKKHREDVEPFIPPESITHH